MTGSLGGGLEGVLPSKDDGGRKFRKKAASRATLSSMRVGRGTFRATMAQRYALLVMMLLGACVFREPSDETPRALDAGLIDAAIHESEKDADGVAPTRCRPGTYVASLLEGLCAACPSGSFSDAPDAMRCRPWSDCLPGTYVSELGSDTSDRQCAPCAVGTESRSPNQGECIPSGTCAAGTVLRPGGKPSDCDPCAPGEHCPGAGLPKEPCTPGRWDHDSDPSTPCVEATRCETGQRVLAAPTALSDRSCTACESGTFSASSNASACAEWTTCLPGTFVSQQGTGTSDRACTPCPSGTQATSQNQSLCLAKGACPAGTKQTAPSTPTSDPVCEPCLTGGYCPGDDAPESPCPSGTWDDDNSAATACIPWTFCVPGQSVFTEGSRLSDRTCVSCGSGTFSVNVNAASCAMWTSCEAGSYVSASGSPMTDRVCAACPNGTYTTARNQTECLPVGACEAGTLEIQPATPRTPAVCEACEIGSYCAGGSAVKLSCTSGTWDHDSNSATACVAWTTCQLGEVIASSGSATTNRTCTACTSGFTTTTNAASCTPWSTCPAGTVQVSPGTATSDTVCSSCSDGVRNGAETDVDCGGSCSTKCATGGACSVNADCTTNLCSSGRCRSWDPSSLSPAFWLDASDAATTILSGGLVSEWRDKSGNGRHATQSNSGARPSYVANGLNGNAIIRFPDNGKSLSFAASYSTVGRSYAFVLMRESSGNITPLLLNSGNYSYLHYGSAWYDGNGNVSAPMTSSSWYVNVSVAGSRTSNGSAIGSGQGTESSFSIMNSAFSTVAWNAAELVIVAGTLSASDRQKLEGYLAWKWGLQGSLPASHPYKSAAP
jgi:hypothetical protein